MDKDLLKQIKNWHESEEHEEIVEAILGIPEKDRDYEAISMLARAYNNLENYKEAERFLLSVKQEGEKDNNWYHRIGYSYYFQEKIEEAREMFTKALELNEENKDSRAFLNWCTELLIEKRILPKLEDAKNKQGSSSKEVDFDKRMSSIFSWKERVKTFWDWFEKNEKTISDIAENKNKHENREDAVDFLSKGVDVVCEDIKFNIGGDHEFTFACDGQNYLFYLLPNLVSSMPSKYKNKWHFFPYMQSAKGENFFFEMYGIKVDMKDIDIEVTYDEERNKFDLRFYNKDIAKLKENELYNMFFIMMDITIGESMSRIYIGSVEKSEEALENTIPLNELENFVLNTLKENEKEVIDRADECYSGYGFTPKEIDSLRYDIISGTTSYTEILDDYYGGEKDNFDKLLACGAKAVFITFPYSSDEERNDVLQKRYEITDRIEKEILGEKGEGKEKGIVLGGAIGTLCCYMDFILYDEKYFMANVGEVLKDYDYDFYISDFYKDSEIVKL